MTMLLIINQTIISHMNTANEDGRTKEPEKVPNHLS